MQLVTPPEISLQTHPYGWKHQQRLAVTVMLAVPLDNALPYSAQDAWSAIAERMPNEEIFDTGLPKPRAEALVYGHYHAPDGYATSADSVALELSTVQKHLTVTGERQWRALIAPTSPEPFTKLPLTYQYGFGGEDSDCNPVGIGFERENGKPLPQLEYTKQLLTSKGQTPPPAGFNATSVDWLPRKKLWGTYDDNWQKNEAPFFANNLNPDFFMQAAQDQWLHGYLMGGERFKLTNMHPEKRVIEGTVPQYRFKLLASLKDQSEHLLDCKIDTAVFIPDSNVLALLARTEININTMDGEEILYLTAAYEDCSETARTLEHYRQHTQARINDQLDDEALLDYSPLRPASVGATLAKTGNLSQLAAPVSPKPTAQPPGPLAISALGLGALAAAAVVGAAVASKSGGTGGGDTDSTPEGTAAVEAEAAQNAAIEAAIAEADKKLPEAMAKIKEELAKLGVEPETADKLLSGQSSEEETVQEDIQQALNQAFPESEEVAALEGINLDIPETYTPILEQKLAELEALQKENLANLPSSGDPGFDQAIQNIAAGSPQSSDLKAIPLDQVQEQLDLTNQELELMLTKLPEHNEQMPDEKQIPSDDLVDLLNNLIEKHSDS